MRLPTKSAQPRNKDMGKGRIRPGSTTARRAKAVARCHGSAKDTVDLTGDTHCRLPRIRGVELTGQPSIC